MTLYRLSKAAERDVIEIARYLAEKGESRATAKECSRSRRKNIKSIIGSAKGGILVLHVFHGARDQTKAWTPSTAGKKKLF